MIGKTCWRFAEVDSTQKIAFRLAELGADHGTVVRADYQSAGRGRQGKVWEASRDSSLMFSILLRPNLPLHELGGISILVADTLADVVADLVSAPVQIKWPNDVLIDGLKTSGILLQTRSGSDPVAVIGIGINIDSPADSMSQSATCLNRHARHPIDVDALFTSLLGRMNMMWETFQPTFSESEIEKLESRLWQHGKMVSIIDADRALQGRILGLAKNGGLRLSVEGSERVVVAGEIVRGPRPVEVPNVN